MPPSHTAAIAAYHDHRRPVLVPVPKRVIAAEHDQPSAGPQRAERGAARSGRRLSTTMSTPAEVELDRSRLFNIDASELRGKLRADLIVPNPTAVVPIIGVRP